MRSDYILYSLALLFFVVTAVSLFVVSEEGSRNLYAVSTAVAGLALASAGFLLKPKRTVTSFQAPPATTEPTVAQEQAPAPQPVPQPAVLEAPSAIVPKIEAPIVEMHTVETPLAQSAPAPVISVGDAVTPAMPISSSAEAEPPVSAPPEAEAPANLASSTASELTQIRGISSKRAEQMKANGVSSIKELAGASSADLAAKLQVSEKIVKMWIGSAKKLAK
jgi:predicted flap endonuclease-1-like 5' DNA nuclease